MTADQSRTSDIDRLSEAVHSLRKSLECTICLEFIKEPIKTRCGHSFCKACISQVLQSKEATCPLCKKSLTRRNVSKDDHMQTCIERFIKLVSAIQADSNIDNASDANRPNRKRKPLIKPPVFAQASANSDRQTDKASTSRETVIDRDTSRDDSKLPSQAAITLSDPAAYPLPDKHDDRYCTPDIKVRTWLRSFSEESTTDVEIVDGRRATKGKVTRSPTLDDNSKSSRGSEMRPGKGKTSRGRKREVSSEHFNESNMSRAESDTQKSGEKKEIDSSASGLKYDKIHARIRKKDGKRDKEQERPSAEESAIDAPDRANLNTSSANWSRVIEFGKEMRDKTKKVKRLNVRIEKNEKPKIVQDVVLSPKSKIDPTRLPANRTIDSSIDRSEINVSDLLEDEASGKQTNVAGTSVSISLKRPKTVKDAVNSSTSDHSALETSYITLEENKKIRIMNLSNDQVNNILGVNEGDSQNRHATPDLSPRKLTVLTPEKLNERCGKTSINARSVSHLPARNRSLPETREKSSEVRRRSGEINFPQMRTPENSRLSLKRKLVVSGNRDANSPPLGRLSLVGRSSAGEHVDDHKGATSPEAGGVAASDRLARVRRNMSTQIDEDLSRTERDGTPATSSLRRSKDEDDRGNGVSRQDERLVSDFTGRSSKSRRLEAPKRDSRVIFVQLGSMNRRRQTKYYYLGRMNREQSLAAEVRDVSVYNMQQSISKSEMLRHVANTSRLSLATPPLNYSQEVAMATTQYFAKSLNTSRVAATENPKLSASSSTCRAAAASSIDQRTKHSSTNVNTRSSTNEDKENARSPETPCEGESAFREISCVSLRRTFLSPDKDSQLKFLQADSLASECALGRGNPTQRRSELAKPVTKDCFSEKGQSPASKKQESSSSENFDKKRKRRVTNEMFRDEESSDLSDVADDASSHDGRDKSSKGVKSVSGANKRRRLSSADDAISDPDERRTPPVKKYRRIITCPSTDSESLCTMKLSRDDDRTDSLHTSIASSVAQRDADREQRIRSILQNWNREHKEMISRDNIEIIWKKGQESPSSVKTVIRIPREEESAFGQSYRVTNALETEKKVAYSSQKVCPAKESQMFESNSIFYSDNLDYIMGEPASGIETPDKLVRASNNDIINRVLQIDRSSSDARQSQAAAPRGDGTSQGEETGGGDYLLQDNFDEIIANVDLPQSEKTAIPCSTPARNPDRTPAGEKTPSCPAMTDEPCGATQETPVIASANDIFEQSVYFNANERPFGASGGNSDKENVALCQKTYTIDDDLGGKIKARGREKSLDHGDGTWIGAERHRDDGGSTQNRNLSGHQSKDSQNDSLMNVTRDQLRLQIFEEDLFGVISSASSKETDVILRDDLHQEASTPKREKRSDLRDKNMSPREHAEENDVVENTPESKIKKSGNRSIATADSRRNIALSFLTPKSTDWTPISTPSTPAVERIPFCQDAPRERSGPVAADCLNVRTENRKAELATHGVVLPAKQIIGKTLENTRQRLDRRTLCVVCSSLTTTQTETVKDFAAKYKIKFADRFDPKIVTHVIVNTTGKENAAVSTLKYLQGIAHRKWIVSYRWVEDCVKKEKILDEAPYEATTFCDGIFPASRNSRLREKDLFEGFVFVCIGPYDNVTPAEYQDLLLATGATVVDSIKDLDKKEGLKGILIKDGAHDNKVIGKWYRTVKAAPIPIDWIVDCIGRYKLLKLTSYFHYISPEDYYALGYPRDLVEDEECSDDDLLIIK